MKYRRLQAGEIVQKGDEWKCWISSKWIKTCMVGKIVGGTPYRRPIKKKKGSK